MSGSDALTRLKQDANAKFPALTTPSGTSMLVKLLQLVNAYMPMHVRPSFIVTLDRLMKFLNAYEEMSVTSSDTLISMTSFAGYIKPDVMTSTLYEDVVPSMNLAIVG